MSGSNSDRKSVGHAGRRRRLLVHAGVTLVSAAVAVLVLSNAGFRWDGWAAWMPKWMGRHEVPRAHVVLLPKVVSPVPQQAKERLGTDASAAKVARHLHLIRTIPGLNAHRGTALIGADRAHPQTYVAGAILESGARIEEIYADHVVLVRGITRVSLYVEGAALRGTEVSRAAEALLAVGGSPPEIPERHLSADPITDYLRPVPVYENGTVAGFAVYAGALEDILHQWGLKAGDVITALDGQPLTEADQALALFNALTEGRVMSATVRRRTAESAQVTLDGQAIAQLAAARASVPPRRAVPVTAIAR